LGNGLDAFAKCISEESLNGVLLSAHSDYPITEINTDGYKWVSEITRKMVQKGKDRPVYVGYGEDTKEETLRYKGFLYALKSEKCTRELQDIWIKNSTCPLSEMVMQRTRQGCNGFVCWNDIIAEQVLNILEANSINVPEEVALTGFDDSSQEGRQSVITTVHQTLYEKGSCAVRILLDQIGSVNPSIRKEYVECNIVERDTL